MQERERQRLTVCMAQQLKQQLKLFQDQQERSMKKIGDETAKFTWRSVQKKKEVLNHLDIVEIYATNFECAIDSGISGPSAADLELPIGPNTVTSPDFENSEYQLLSLLSDRLAPENIPLPNLQTKKMMMSDVSSEQPGIDWNMEEDWENKYQTDP